MAAAALLLVSCGDGEEDAATPTLATASTTTTDSTTSTTTGSPTTDSTTTASSSTTVAPTTSSSSVTASPSRTVQVFQFASGFDGSDCLAVEAFEREVEAASPIRSALDQLVAGPTDDEQAQGVGSTFSAATAGSVQSVKLEAGLLIVDFVDFRSLLPNATSSCGSGSLLAQLTSTVYQFPEVETVRYQIDGSCEAFYDDWLPWSCTVLQRPSLTP